MTLESFWHEYKTRVMEPDSPQVQYDECENAFYAGFVQCLVAVSALQDGLTEEQALNIFAGWKKELEVLIEKRRL